MKEDKVCERCGSDNIRLDAWTVWDIEKQEWVLDNVFGDAYCINCEDICYIKDVSIEE